MYKNIKLSNKHSITFNKFRKQAKDISHVYKTGIRNWIADDSYNYSIVVGTFRLIFTIERDDVGCSPN
jgi:mRNA-degrading endonuclease RelE of RelBE toxin-antitoxin system